MAMKNSNNPLVSIVTPVYNGERYLDECIESIVAQTYTNWEYLIVDNCSKDKTFSIAQRYADKDPRIRVWKAEDFVDIIENHNRAFRAISKESKYCKVLSADDFLFPECIEKMVELAESNPSIGILSSYQLSGGEDKWYVRTDGLPYRRHILPGHDVARAQLMGVLDVLGNPTSNLYRADLVRATNDFYPNSTAEADISGCFECMKVADFGFVHQVLTYERLHNVRITAVSQDRNAYLSSKLGDLQTYGPIFLTVEERQERMNELIDEYYKFLAISAVNFRRGTFWAYHKKRLSELGHPLSFVRLSVALGKKILDLLLNPKMTIERIMRRTASSNTRYAGFKSAIYREEVTRS